MFAKSSNRYGNPSYRGIKGVVSYIIIKIVTEYESKDSDWNGVEMMDADITIRNKRQELKVSHVC